jgi:putative ABC transport system permease protein
MKATWRVARAAVRRRKLQTLIIGVVVMISTATIVLALGILATVDKPFDKAFARLQGAHLTVAYDSTKVTAAQLSATAQRPGVTAAAGPFATAVIEDPGFIGSRPGPITVAGRAEQNGPVDRLALTSGRWLSGPGEIVVKQDPKVRCNGGVCQVVGRTVKLPDGKTLTVVGVAQSITQSADAWVVPAQMTALKPHNLQMLYRFTDSTTSVSAVTAGLPQDAVAGSRSYLVAKVEAADNAKSTIPFLLTFGVLGLIVAVLIIGNVVSGAVVSGFRHIGVMKALGFTPAQVTGAYVVMIAVPSVVGSAIGVGVGNLLAKVITSDLSDAIGTPPDGVALWVDVVAFVGALSLVAVTALVPALRAGRLSAAEAVSAGAVPHRGRALGVQRILARTSLPRPVSLGLGLPFARPGRSALTLAAVSFGVAAVTFACGLLWTVGAYSVGESRGGAAAVSVDTALPAESGPDPRHADPNGRPIEEKPTLTGGQAAAALRAMPGTAQVAAAGLQRVHVVGVNGNIELKAYEDGLSQHGYDMARGRWLQGQGEAVVPGEFLRSSGKKLGDTMTVEIGGRQAALRIVGEIIGPNDQIVTDWQSLSSVAPGLKSTWFEMRLKDGVDPRAYAESLNSVLGGRLGLSINDDDDLGILLALIATLTLGLATVAALGVFNTVVLNTRDRIRDFGILKSIGTTPGQITGLVITSMIALGLAGGLVGVPLGIITHHVIMPITADAGGITLPDAYLEVYGPLVLVLLTLAGVAIGTIGALIPAGWASRLKTSTALRSE